MAQVWTFPVPVLEVIDLNAALMKYKKNQGFSDLIAFPDKWQYNIVQHFTNTKGIIVYGGLIPT
jgi:hypothetical protein